LQHFVKDMSIALEEAQRMKLALPGLALAQQLYTALVAQGDRSTSLSRKVQRIRFFDVYGTGHGKKGTQSLILALQTLNGITKNA
jgi:3-hydroxyisobutyrate dehydrogenase